MLIRDSGKAARKKAKLRQWHSWFAWRPISTDAGWVWLETVERRLSEGYYEFWMYERIPKTK